MAAATNTTTVWTALWLLGTAALTMAATMTAASSAAGATRRATLDLGGTWQLHNAAGNVSTTATVPGEVHTDLLRAGVLLQDPYFRYNDIEYRWVVFQDWTVTRTFAADSIPEGAQIRLVCEGIDTVATVELNGAVVGTTENMFRRYEFDVTGAVSRTGTNTLVVTIKSATREAKERADRYPYPLPESTEPDYSHGELHRNMLRKSSCSFAWDWGPCFAPQGIWRPIYLEYWQDLRVSRAQAVVLPHNSAGSYFPVNAAAAVLWSGSGAVSGSLSVHLVETGLSITVPVALQPGEQEVAASLSVPDSTVQLWWPVGYGAQPLYNVDITVTADGAPPITVRKRIGFRTAELVQEPYADGRFGESFYFRINGVPIWAKGSNWVPADSFESRVTPDVVRRLLQSVLDANMNMVRIWGGGLYPGDEFYDFCDETGLLVWEEFMFACALYPSDSKFLANVAEEVKYQVRRLVHHPSIVVWSGNNENEQAITQNWFAVTRMDPYTYAVDYDRLYHATIRNALLPLDESRPFLSSSPANGVWSTDPFAERWIAPNGDTSTSEYFGDQHYYNYVADSQNVATMMSPRFSSEYGFQSMPSFFSIEKISLPEDWAWDSAFFKFRNHRTGDGQSEIANQMKLHFHWPNSGDSLKDFKDFIYLSQVNQAYFYQAQTEHYRRSKTAEANTMGALYWQLNDIWQAPTWSSLEYGGRWKLLHHAAKHFFAPLLVSSLRYTPTDDGYSIYVVSDVNAPLNGTMTLSIWSWADGGTLVDTVSVEFALAPLDSKAVFSGSIAELTHGQPTEHVFVLEAQATTTENASYANRNVFFPAKLKDVTSLPRATLNVTVTQQGPTELVARVRTDTIALFVALESPYAGRFDDNGFLMLPGEERAVPFYAWEDVPSAEDFRATLVARTYSDVLP